MDLLTWLLVGLAAGVLASMVVGGSGYGLLGDICVGIAGAFVGSWVFQQLHWRSPMEGLPGVIVVAAVGALLLLIAIRLVRRVAPPPAR